jgi:hypothetical protein
MFSFFKKAIHLPLEEVGVFSQKLIKEHSFLLQRKKRDLKKNVPDISVGK